MASLLSVQGGDSVIVYSVFVVAPIVCERLMLGLCFVLQYFVSFYLAGEKRAGCVLNVMSLYSFFYSSSWCHELVCSM